MRTLITAALATLLALPAFAAEPKTEDQKTLYAVGLVMARQLSVFELTPAELDFVKQGLSDGTTSGKTPLVEVEAYKNQIQKLALARRDAQGVKLAAKAKTYTDATAKEKGAVKTETGLVYVPLKEGTGASPAATEKVKVNYRGTFIDGKEFDSSYASGQPVEFKLNQVIKCWTEGVQKMKVGGKAKLVCPPDIAYGERGSGAIPGNATLVFEVDLLDIVREPGIALPRGQGGGSGETVSPR
jgi:FKBP-type peptidyl-prolyl cis-trans isomerase FkpA